MLNGVPGISGMNVYWTSTRLRTKAGAVLAEFNSGSESGVQVGVTTPPHRVPDEEFVQVTQFAFWFAPVPLSHDFVPGSTLTALQIGMVAPVRFHNAPAMS